MIDSENTKKLMKQHRLTFESYLMEKNIRNPTTAVELVAVNENNFRSINYSRVRNC